MGKRKIFTSFALAAAFLLAAMCMAVVPSAVSAADTPAAETVYLYHGEDPYKSNSLYGRTLAEMQKAEGERQLTLDYNTFTAQLTTGSLNNCEPVDTLNGTQVGTSKSSGVLYSEWQIQTYDNYRAAVIKLTPKYDVKITVETGAMGEGYNWIKGDGKFIETYIEGADGLRAVTRKAVNNDCDLTDDAYFDSYAYVKAGENFYFVVRGWMIVNCLGSFTVSPADYDAAQKNPTVAAAASEGVGFYELTRFAYVSDRKPVIMQNMDVYAYAGDVTAGVAQPFPYAVKSGDSVELKDTEGEPAYMLSGGNARSTEKIFPIVCVTAKENIVFTYDFTLSTDWFYNSKVKVYVESGDTRLLYASYTMENGPDATDTTQATKSVHMKAGDKLYIEFSGNGTILLNWTENQLRNVSAGYDEAARPPYEQAGELASYASAKDYTADGWKSIESIVAAAIDELGIADDAAAVVTKAKSDIDAVKKGKTFSDIAPEIIAVTGYAQAENALIKYAAGTGTPDDMTAFTQADGDMLKNATEQGEPEHDNHVNTFQLRATGNKGTVLAFTAKTDAELLFTFTAATDWAYNSYFALYAQSADNCIPVYTGTFAQASGRQSLYINASVHAATGDTVYLVMTTDGSRNTVEFSGQVTEGTYDADKRPDYARAVQIAGLADKKNYTADSWAEIEDIIVEKIIELSGASDRDAVVEAARTAVAAIAMGKEYGALVNEMVAAGGEFAPISYASAQMGLYASSNVRTGKLQRMTGIYDDQLYYTTSDKADIHIDSDCQVALAAHQILSHGMSAVVSVKALKDMKVTTAVPQLGDGWNWVLGEGLPGASVVYYIDDGERIYKVKSTKVVATDGDYGYTAHLKAGETLYYTILGEWVTVNLIPTFTFGDDYDAAWTFDTCKDAEESFVWQEMVSTQVLAGGDEQTGDLLNWEFMYGESLDKLEAFDVEVGTEEPDHALYVGTVSDPSCAVWRWQWRVSNPYMTVLRFTATEDIYLEMKHGAIKLVDYVPAAYVKTVVENAAGIRITRKTYVPKVNNQADAYFCSEHLAKGDTLYLILQAIDSEAGSWPHTLAMTSTEADTTFKADRTAYDASKRADYAAEEALIAYRAEKAAEIQAYVQTLDEDAYSSVNWLVIREYADGLETTVAGLNSNSEIDAAYAAVKANIDAVPTVAAQKAELDAYKTQKKAELAEYAKESDYTADNWKKITEYIESANASIDAAKSTTGVDTAVAAARNRIDQIEKKKADKGCGCGGAAAGGVAMLALLALGVSLVALAARRRAGQI